MTNESRMNTLIKVDRSLFLLDEISEHSASIMDDCLSCNAPWESDDYLDDLHEEFDELAKGLANYNFLGMIDSTRKLNTIETLNAILKWHSFLPDDDQLLTTRHLAILEDESGINYSDMAI